MPVCLQDIIIMMQDVSWDTSFSNLSWTDLHEDINPLEKKLNGSKYEWAKIVQQELAEIPSTCMRLAVAPTKLLRVPSFKSLNYHK